MGKTDGVGAHQLKNRHWRLESSDGWHPFLRVLMVGIARPEGECGGRGVVDQLGYPLRPS